MTSQTPQDANGVPVPPPDFDYILRLVRRILPNGYDHESIAGDLVCKAIGTGARPSFTSIRNFCIDQVRRHNSELYANEAYASRRGERFGHSPGSQTADGTLAAILSSARLDAGMREILIHKYWLGRSDAEIATVLRVPAYRVTELRNQALVRLRTVARELDLKGDQL